MTEDIITDHERYPTLTDHGRKMLEFLREHPHAPLYRNQSGNRLTAPEIEAHRAFESEVLGAQIGWSSLALPSWLDSFIEHCFSTVPFYRAYGSRPASFHELPTISRAELSHDIAQFVPDGVPTERLINFRTS